MLTQLLIHNTVIEKGTASMFVFISFKYELTHLVFVLLNGYRFDYFERTSVFFNQSSLHVNNFLYTIKERVFYTEFEFYFPLLISLFVLTYVE